ncbi:MAG: Arginine decarboxylase [Myxococcota bacterium]|nr:Arginine decarboxylase [Myxococcota bacterium]
MAAALTALPVSGRDSIAGRQVRAPLFESIQAFVHRNQAVFYCPGHKGGRTLPEEFKRNIAAWDINNLPETDTLHCPSGPILEAEELLAEAYGVDKSFILVGGSTAGNIAAIMSAAGPGQKLLAPRNAHKSVIAGIVLSGAQPVWITPEFDAGLGIAHGLSAASAGEAFHKHPDARALFALNPTYFGATPDIRALLRISQEHGVPLLVDEAHGPHFHFHPELPLAAEDAGACAVVQSTHKILSGLSQAAVLHLRTERLAETHVRKMLQLIQTTSPNFAVMASIDLARRQMALDGEALWTEVLRLARETRERLRAIPGLRLLEKPPFREGGGFVNLDETKIVMDVTELGWKGHEAHEFLNRRDVQPEVSGESYVLCIMTVGSNQEDCDRLVAAMQALARGKPPARIQEGEVDPAVVLSRMPRVEMTPRDAFYAETVTVPFDASKGRVCAEVVTPYPPGIPVLMPGEIIDRDTLDFLRQVLMARRPVSASDPTLGVLRVVR